MKISRCQSLSHGLYFLKDFSFDGEDYLHSSSQNRHVGFEKVTDIGGRMGYPLH
jgi:hypothetical protein